MRDEIRELGEMANKVEIRLRRKLFGLENYLNECECSNAVKYDFANTLPKDYDCRVMCLNCGGKVSEK